LRFYIPSYHIYWNDGLDENKGLSVVVDKKEITLTYVDLPSHHSIETIGVSIPIGHTKILLASIYKSLLIAWRDADITEHLNLRTKFILIGDLNEEHLFGIVKSQIPQD
jgi:hypothetical protein